MTNRSNDPSQAPVAEEGGVPPHALGPQAQQDQLHSRSGNKVFRSGPLFLSSKGIGWTSWKKRWFILTRTSLVFFRSDPNAVPQKGGEANLTLGGIDLNNSGSVVVKADKKLLTVLFPDGRDGRAFTLKAETLEDLFEWKAALEEALAQAPSPTLVMGQNGIFRNDQADTCDDSAEQPLEKQPVKSLVIGRPVLLALEDIDGTPSFLEKALRFVEEHGVKVEGILRQAAYVDDVERRIREYEQGKTDFSAGEDAHVIGDCVKYILRELPSSPVPASCCNALVEACKTDRGRRVAAMREAICETFPEPNRRLLQRILQMMQVVSSHKAENRMNSSAVAACMAPLLLRPLLAGDCELEHDFDVGGDGSFQLLQAAAAANHAQAIVVTLLEEYDSIFGQGTMSTELYSDTEESGSESEELSDEDYYSTEDEEDEDGTEGSEVDIDEDSEHGSVDSHNENHETGDDYLRDDKGCGDPVSGSKSNESDDDHKAKEKLSSGSSKSLPTQHDNSQEKENNHSQKNNDSKVTTDKSGELLGEPTLDMSSAHKSDDKSPSSQINGPVRGARRQAVWGRAHGKKNLSMESIDLPFEDEYEGEIERLEATKNDLQKRIAEEAKGNAVLQESLERRKKALQERRRALEQDVAKLQEQLQKERDLRIVLEAGLKMPKSLPAPSSHNEKATVELENVAQPEGSVTNLKQTADSPGVQLNQHRQQNQVLAHHLRNPPLETPESQEKLKEREQETEIAATSRIPQRSTSKDVPSEKVNSDKDTRRDNPGLANQSIPQNQLSGPVQNSPPVGTMGTSSPAEPAAGLSAPTPSKKFTNRGEGNTTASSALSKLTNRLNFLKERRNLLAGEIQTLDKDQSSGSTTVQNVDKGRGEDSNQLANSNSETNSGGDKGRSGGQPAPDLEKGKSESFPKAEKGRRSEDPPHSSQMINSR